MVLSVYTCVSSRMVYELFSFFYALSISMVALKEADTRVQCGLRSEPMGVEIVHNRASLRKSSGVRVGR
jgi:hypothetical protein